MDEGANSIMADQLITGTTLVEKESRSIGDTPIGGIVAWAKTLAGVPNLAEGWVECDGEVLVDALSPLNGQTIPDLNGDNRFLKGNSTSGTEKVAEWIASTNILLSDNNGSVSGNGVQGIQSGNPNEHLAAKDRWSTGGAGNVYQAIGANPASYTVVWIMRVR